MLDGELQKRMRFLINIEAKADPKIVIKWLDEAKKELFVAFNTSKVETWHKLKKWFGESDG